MYGGVARGEAVAFEPSIALQSPRGVTRRVCVPEHVVGHDGVIADEAVMPIFIRRVVVHEESTAALWQLGQGRRANGCTRHSRERRQCCHGTKNKRNCSQGHSTARQSSHVRLARGHPGQFFHGTQPDDVRVGSRRRQASTLRWDAAKVPARALGTMLVPYLYCPDSVHCVPNITPPVQVQHRDNWWRQLLAEYWGLKFSESPSILRHNSSRYTIQM